MKNEIEKIKKKKTLKIKKILVFIMETLFNQLNTSSKNNEKTSQKTAKITAFELKNCTIFGKKIPVFRHCCQKNVVFTHC